MDNIFALKSLLPLLLGLFLPLSLFAETAAEAPAPAPVPAAAPSPTPFALSNVVSELEKTDALRRKIEADLASKDFDASIEKELLPFTAEINSRLNEDQAAISKSLAFESLPDLETYWRSTQKRLEEWKQQLTERDKALNGYKTSLSEGEEQWKKIQKEAKEADAPDEVKKRIAALSKGIQAISKEVQNRIDKTQSKLTTVITLESKVNDILDSVRREIVKGLLVRDRPPLWADSATSTGNSINPLSEQWKGLTVYVERHSDLFISNGLIFLLFWGVLARVRALGNRNPLLEEVRPALNFSLPGALIVALLIWETLYPQPPRFFWTFWAGLALGASFLILRRFLAAFYHPLLLALFGMLLFDEVRDVFVASPYAWRWTLLAESLAGLLFVTWFLRFSPFAAQAEEKRNFQWHSIRALLSVASLFFGVSFIANLLGYVRPAGFLVNAVAECLNHAAVYYSLVLLTDGYGLALLTVGPVSQLAAIRRHRDLLWGRLKGLVRLATAALVATITCEMLGVGSIVSKAFTRFLETPLAFASPNLTVADIFHFILTIGGAFYLSRFIRFILDEEVYPHLKLSRGLPYAISTVLHYAILCCAFFASVGDLSKFSILAGAFGVGLGFGLQNIFNNFVSGLILLFERPVKVGDMLQVDGDIGTVKQIGIRASVVRTESGSELIIPNGKLISDKVVNWTFSHRSRAFTIALNVPRTMEPQCLIELMEKTTLSLPSIARHPAPKALLVKLNPTSYDIELQAYTYQVEEWATVRSDLTVAVHNALTEANVFTPAVAPTPVA